MQLGLRVCGGLRGTECLLVVRLECGRGRIELQPAGQIRNVGALLLMDPAQGGQFGKLRMPGPSFLEFGFRGACGPRLRVRFR